MGVAPAAGFDGEGEGFSEGVSVALPEPKFDGEGEGFSEGVSVGLLELNVGVGGADACALEYS